MAKAMLYTGITLFILGILFLFVIGPLFTVSGALSNYNVAILGIFLIWAGLVFIPIGIILAIVGAIVAPKTQYIHTYHYPSPNQPAQQYYYHDPAQQPINQQWKYCTNCGAQILTNANYCTSCGVRFQ